MYKIHEPVKKYKITKEKSIGTTRLAKKYRMSTNRDFTSLYCLNRIQIIRTAKIANIVKTRVNKSVPQRSVAPGKQANIEVREKTKKTVVVSQIGFKYSFTISFSLTKFGNTAKREEPNSIEESRKYIKREKQVIKKAKFSCIFSIGLINKIIRI